MSERLPCLAAVLLVCAAMSSCGTPDSTGDTGEVDSEFPDAGADTDDAADEDTRVELDVVSDGRPEIDLTPDVDIGDAPVELFRVVPAAGGTAGGTRVTVFGAGFRAETVFTINGRRLENVDVIDAFSALATTPPGSPGVYDLKAADSENDATLLSAWTYLAPFALDGISPVRGATSGGTPLSLFGSGFTSAATVSVGGRLCIDTRPVGDERIDCILPEGTVGVVDVRVTDSAGSRVLTGGFTYFDAPAIDRVFPGVGLSAGGETVRVLGRGFIAGTQAFFGPVAVPATRVDSGTLEVVVPPGAPGAVDVVVQNDNGGASLPDGYTYVASSTGNLALRSVQPNRGDEAGGTRFTVAVEGLQDGAQVLIGGAPATVIATDDTSITALSPAGAPGPADVTVRQGLIERTIVDGWTWLPSLKVDSVSPDRGDVDGGDVVVVSGRGFDAETRFFFGPLAAEVVSLMDSTSASVRTPPGSPGASAVRVERGASTHTADDVWTYTIDTQLFGLAPELGSVAGNTWVVLRGTGFSADAEVSFGLQPATDVQLLDPSTLGVRTPAAAPGAVDVTVETRSTEDGGASVGRATLAAAYTYYDPASGSGGWSGGEIDGSVNVAVFNANGGAPIPAAFVTLSVRGSDTRYTGRTDGNGRVTISGPELRGEQVINATATKFSSSTSTAVNSRNVTLLLEYICPCYEDDDCGDEEQMCLPRQGVSLCSYTDGPAASCTTGDDCEGYGNGNYVCSTGRCVEKCWCGCAEAGECLAGQTCNDTLMLCQIDTTCSDDDDCAAEGNFVCIQGTCTENCTGPAPTVATIEGQLTGIGKIVDPAPNETVLGVVLTTTNTIFSNNPDPGTENQRTDDGRYRLTSRLGDLAVVAMCGLFNNDTGDFLPLYIGVERGVFAQGDRLYEVDVDCNIPLDRSLSVKIPNPPFGARGTMPDLNRAIPYLDFGGEGVFGGYVLIEGTDSVISRRRFASLEGPLEGLSYLVYGGTFSSTGGLPFAAAIVDDIRSTDNLVTLPEMVPPPILVQPEPQTVFDGRRVEWELGTDAPVDFYYIRVQDVTQQITFWDVWVPGDKTAFNLPYWPEGSLEGPFPPRTTLVITVLAIRARSFSWDGFTLQNLVFESWEAYSANGWAVVSE